MPDLLINNARDIRKISKTRKSLRLKGGGLTNGKIPSEKWSEKWLGELIEKVVLASSNIENLNIDNNEFTVLGGLCSVRTKCLREISNGIIPKLTKFEEQKEFNLENLKYWLENNVSADQIFEAVGICNVKNLVVISEDSLWTERIINLIQDKLDFNLSETDKKGIYSSICIGNSKRIKAISKIAQSNFLKKISVKNFSDSEVLDKLTQIRDDLYASQGLNFNDEINNVIKKYNYDEKRIKYIKKYLNGISLVWTMYTPQYLRMLQDAGIVKTESAVIVEPWSHAINISAGASTQFKLPIFGNKEIDLFSKTSNLGFIGLTHVSEHNFKKAKDNLSINEVPNLKNYKTYISNLKRNSSRHNFELRNNKVFIDGYNFSPYKSIVKNLKLMVNLSKEYKDRRSIFVKNKNRESFENRKFELKQKMNMCSSRIINDLEELFTHIFTD